MTDRTRRLRLAWLLMGGALCLPPPPALAQPAPEPAVVGRSGQVVVQVGQGQVVHLPGQAANVYVADPKVAEVRPASPTSLFVFGTGIGSTTLAALDATGALVTQLQISVGPNTSAANAAASAVRRAVPSLAPRTSASLNGLTVAGSAATPDEANRAAGTARQFTGQGQTLQNNIEVRASTQVGLQVTIAEMSRNVTRELGVSWQSLGGIAGRYAVGFANPITLLNTTGAATLTTNIKSTSFNNIIEALAQDNLARMLAQPNLTAMSGETASFLVGGEFPIPVAQDNNAVTVAFKQYGISLAFVPTVLSSGRINLHVRTEVSALTDIGAVRLSSTNAAISIPAITVRRADTTVELGSGQSFAIAGLLQDTVTQQDVSVPWLGEVPILGALFRSSSFIHNKSELVILVTPTIQTPVDDRSRLHTPDEAYAPPSDAQRFLLLHQAERAPQPVPVAAPPSLGGFVLQ